MAGWQLVSQLSQSVGRLLVGWLVILSYFLVSTLGWVNPSAQVNLSHLSVILYFHLHQFAFILPMTRTQMLIVSLKYLLLFYLLQRQHYSCWLLLAFNLLSNLPLFLNISSCLFSNCQ